MKRAGGTASGAVANLAAQGIPFVVLIVVTPILLDELGRERYGALVLFNLVPQIAGQLDLGIVTAATRGFAQYSARRDRSGAMNATEFATTAVKRRPARRANCPPQQQAEEG